MAPKSPAGSCERGFTVAELLVVLLIIGLIAAVAVPNVSGAIRRAEEAALRENLQVIPPSGMPDSRWGFPSGPISDSMW